MTDLCGCYRRLQVRPFPRPLGKDGKLPLLSSAIDGFHVANGRSGLFIRDSYIVNSGAHRSIPPG